MGQLETLQSTYHESLALLCQMNALTAPVLMLLGHQRRSKSSTLRPDERSCSCLPGRIPRCSSSQGPLMLREVKLLLVINISPCKDILQDIVVMVVMQHLLQHCSHRAGLA